MDAPIDKPTEGVVAEEVVPFRHSSKPGAPDPDREARWAAWREENAAAIASSNAWVEEHGLPLAKYRLF